MIPTFRKMSFLIVRNRWIDFSYDLFFIGLRYKYTIGFNINKFFLYLFCQLNIRWFITQPSPGASWPKLVGWLWLKSNKLYFSRQTNFRMEKQPCQKFLHSQIFIMVFFLPPPNNIPRRFRCPQNFTNKKRGYFRTPFGFYTLCFLLNDILCTL